MADKRLVITDMDPTSPDYGAFEAVDPRNATALPIPAFRMGAATPAAGTMAGEGFINTSANTASVWDGNSWVPIVPGSLVVYQTDAAVIADVNQAAGTYATSSQSGNLFVKMAGTGWRQIGVRTYPTATALLADTAAPTGSLGVAIDEETFWVMHGGTWHCHSVRQFATLADLFANWATPQEGARAIETGEGLNYDYSNGFWRPQSIWVKTEAEIQAATDRLEGQLAIASDTGHVYSYHSNQWLSAQVRSYATEQDLLNDSPNNGIIAMAEDNGMVYGRVGGNWRRVNSPTITVSATSPAAPAAGDIQLDPVTGETTIYDGNAWRNISGTPAPVGQISMYPNYSAPAGYMICDGRAVDQNVYPELYAVVGSHVPDLKGQFIRGASSNSDSQGKTKHQDTTRRPRSNLTGTANNAGRHRHFANRDGGSADASWLTGNAYLLSDQYAGGSHVGGTNTLYTNYENDHHHTVTVNGGGDSETAPVHVKLCYIIKARP